jgi:hypothetical protein
VNAAKTGRASCRGNGNNLPILHCERRRIWAPKLADFKHLCAFIPDRYREFCTSLSSKVKSPVDFVTGLLEERHDTKSRMLRLRHQNQIFPERSCFYVRSCFHL